MAILPFVVASIIRTASAESAAPAVSPSPQEITAAPAVAPPVFANSKIVLTPEQSTGGKLQTGSGTVLGVRLERECEKNFKKPSDACILWKPVSPLPAGWWHGVIESNLPNGLYSNKELAFVFQSPQKPSVPIGPNYSGGDKGTPAQLEFWLYSSGPAENVCIKPTSDLWRYNPTWPIKQITLEHIEPAELPATQALTLDLPIQADGTVTLPGAVPMGLWTCGITVRQAGTVTLEQADGKLLTASVAVGPHARYKPETKNLYFYLSSPLQKVSVRPESLASTVLLQHKRTVSAPSIATDLPLTTTVDSSRTEVFQLQISGQSLSAELPTFPSFPKGRRIAIVTSWDDGAAQDMRCAEILSRHGYRPSFFLNYGSEAMKSLDKLESLGVEIGSHCYHHPMLYTIAPSTAVDECVEMRKALEAQLKHPVISFAYPYGYWPAYDTEGDYVLRAVKAAGYWSGRTTLTAQETVDSIQVPETMKSDGFFGNTTDLERIWNSVRTKEGAVFYFWGHSWQIGKTEEHWKKFEDFVAQFANQPDAWYASQGELSLWLWSRRNVQMKITKPGTSEATVEVTRPWLHPYLAKLCPLTLKMPPGVVKVQWKNKEVPVRDGLVELPWQD